MNKANKYGTKFVSVLVSQNNSRQTTDKKKKKVLVWTTFVSSTRQVPFIFERLIYKGDHPFTKVWWREGRQYNSVKIYIINVDWMQNGKFVWCKSGVKFVL